MVKSNKTYRIIFSGGGTGGHIYPAIAVAQEIRSQYPDSEILFVGAQGKLEMNKVPEAGFEIIGLWISGIQRKLTLKNLMFPFKLLNSIIKSNGIIKSFEPDIVAGFGGYASGPIMMAASRKGVKTLIQEQNSYAGVANRSVAKKASAICVAYDGMDKYFQKEKIFFTGNPVRKDIQEISVSTNEGYKYFKLDDQKQTILILGGSGGARTINESVLSSLDKWKGTDIQVIWQCGKFYYEEMKERLDQDLYDFVSLNQFIDRMDLAYKISDIVVSRAGALSISELCIVKRPVIFIPSPNVAEDHQTKNAMALVEKDAAEIVRDTDAVRDLAVSALNLIENSDRRNTLSENIGKLARPDASKSIANKIIELIN